MNACDWIVEYLAKNGLDVYFLVTGGAIVPFINAVSKHHGAKYYCFQHEQSAAMAAEGYFRASGKIAVVCTTSGPGVQNLLNGVCGLWYDSVPGLFITGQVNTAESLNALSSQPRQAGFQEMPVVEIFQSITKLSLKVNSLCDVPVMLRRLMSCVKTPRFGPVVLDLPVDIQMSSFEVEPEVQFVDGIIRPSAATYDLSELFRASKRPLFVFGHGVKLSGCAAEAVICATSMRIPFVVSWGAFDICPTDHPFRIGSHGVYGDRVANYAIQNCDLLIMVGTRMDSRQIGGSTSSFSRFSKKIMVDIDRAEILKLEDKGIKIDHHVYEDAGNFIRTLQTTDLDTHEWLEKLKAWKQKYSVEIARNNDGVVYKYLDNFFTGLPKDAIIIPDQGGNLIWTMQSAKLQPGHALFTNYGNSSMGFALPCAIGAAIGSGLRRPVYCIDGDGGFQMNIQELLTVKKYNLPIHIIILNNSGYGIIKQFQDSYFSSKYVATSKAEVFGDTVSFERIAAAYGIENLTDVAIPETQKIYPKLEFGNSLENMTPYIEFESDMIVETPPRKADGWKSN